MVNFGRRFHPEPGQNCTPVHSLGLLTPIVAIAAIVCHVLAWLNLGHDLTVMTSITLLNAFALYAMLGPGSYSIDAYLFGRRVVVLPRDNLQRPFQ